MNILCHNLPEYQVSLQSTKNYPFDKRFKFFVWRWSTSTHGEHFNATWRQTCNLTRGSGIKLPNFWYQVFHSTTIIKRENGDSSFRLITVLWPWYWLKVNQKLIIARHVCGAHLYQVSWRSDVNYDLQRGRKKWPQTKSQTHKLARPIYSENP